MINYATLGKEVDGIIEYIYPKTSANMVEYTSEMTVEQKIQLIDNDILDIFNKTTDIINDFHKGTYYEKISVNNEELYISNEPLSVKVTIADLVKDDFDLLSIKLTQLIFDSKIGAVNLSAEYTDSTINKNVLPYVSSCIKEIKQDLDNYKASISDMIANALQLNP